MSLEVEIYTTNQCPYCVKAKALFQRKGVTSYQEINVEQNPELRQLMMDRAGGRRTVPQIFINGQHVGGCDDLYALDSEGKLDLLLAAHSS